MNFDFILAKNLGVKRLLAIFFLFVIPHLVFSRSYKIDSIKVEGNRKVESTAVLRQLPFKVGERFDDTESNEAIRKVYDLGYFEEIEIYFSAGELRIVVKEKPVISSVIFNGNDEFDADELKEKMKTKEYDIFDISKVRSDIREISKAYKEKGYYLTAITYEVSAVDKESVNVVLNITESEKLKVKRISFSGNESLSREEIMGFMETREDSTLSFMSGAGTYGENALQTDLERIKFFYRSKGFLQINLSQPQVTITPDNRWALIHIGLVEGPVFNVRNISLEGDLIFPENEIREVINLESKATYSEEKLRKDIQNLTEKYQDDGYAFVNVIRDLKVIPGENLVDVTYKFDKGIKVRFGRIDVTGNSKTRDKVIRRELRIFEGMTYSGSKMRESKSRIERLGFFEPGSVLVDTKLAEGSSDVVNVMIQVKERNTGQISLGAGYQKSAGLFIQASVTQNNFLGKGQALSFTLQNARNDRTASLSFTEPYLFDSLWTAGFNGYYTLDRTRRSFNFRRSGGGLTVGHPLGEYNRVFLGYNIEDIEIEGDPIDPSIVPEVENGIASSAELSIVRDKRNNAFEPNAGHYARAAVEYAGIGFEKKWVKSEMELRWYKNVWREFVFKTRLRGRRIWQTTERKIPRSEKFILGGPRDMRGFDIEGIGPTQIDPASQIRFNTGGNFSVLSSFELTHPLVREAGIKWAVFFDAGNVFEDYIGKDDNYKLRANYGFGFRWFSPLGILRFEWGYPINRRDGESPSQFFFDIGQNF